MDEKIKNIYDNYLKKAKEVYGELPSHCFSTKLTFEECPDNPYASGADCEKNIIYINPSDKDIEWTIFHEMEHIRTAHSIGESQLTGFRSSLGVLGDGFNEALTEISVRQLLGRDQDKIGYYEVIILAKQFGAILGLDEKNLVKFYSKNGRDELSKLLKQQTGEDCLENIIQAMDNVQELHRLDLDKEFKENGKILQKPLGMTFSKSTQQARIHYKQILDNAFSKIIRKGDVSHDELVERYKQFIELSPYKNHELELGADPVSE